MIFSRAFTALATAMAILFVLGVVARGEEKTCLDPLEIGCVLSGVNIFVRDGDSLDLGWLRIRLYGIDAPELGQICERKLTQTVVSHTAKWPCGEMARQQLEDLVHRSEIECRVLDVDQYGRAVAQCHVLGAGGSATDLGGSLVAAGLAVAYTRYRQVAPGLVDHYLTLEKKAAGEKLGVHAGPFEQPEAWRRWNPRR